MFESWLVPEATCNAIKFHHQLDAAGDAALRATIVHLADVLANALGTGSFSQTVVETIDLDADLLMPLGIDLDYDYDQLLGIVDEKFIETVYLLVA